MTLDGGAAGCAAELHVIEAAALDGRADGGAAGEDEDAAAADDQGSDGGAAREHVLEAPGIDNLGVAGGAPAENLLVAAAQHGRSDRGAAGSDELAATARDVVSCAVPAARMVCPPPLEIVVPLARPPDETNASPATKLSKAVPPEPTFRVPPLSTDTLDRLARRKAQRLTAAHDLSDEDLRTSDTVVAEVEQLASEILRGVEFELEDRSVLD